jgi:hypothetical protein
VDSDEPIEEGILMRPIRIGVLGVLAFVPASWALDEPPGAPSAKAGSLRLHWLFRGGSGAVAAFLHE